MPEKNVENQKKGRLGRGLNSLLGGATSAAKPVETSSPKSDATIVSTQAMPQETIQNTSTTEAKPVNPAPVATPVASAVPPEARIWKIAVEKLHPNEYQPRQKFNKDSLKELSNSIKDKGILQPIVARRHASGALEIISGERRWRAAQMAGLQDVPVIIRTVNDQDSLELAIIENIQREDLNPIDEAEAYQRLAQEFKLTQQQIAEKVGKERATVANSMRLLLLADPVREMLVNQEISVGHCKVLLSIENPKTQAEVARKATKEQLSVRALEKVINKVQKGLSIDDEDSQKIDPKSAIKDKLIKNLGEELQKLLGTKVAIEYNDGKGRVLLSFYSDAEFNQLTDKLKSAWQK
jgi:ParB family chromosome partitioning protein